MPKIESKPAAQTPVQASAQSNDGIVTTEAAVVRPPEPEVAPAKKGVKRARVRSKVGPMVHLPTGVKIDETERMVDIDGFTQAQIDAGKWEIVA